MHLRRRHLLATLLCATALDATTAAAQDVIELQEVVVTTGAGASTASAGSIGGTLTGPGGVGDPAPVDGYVPTETTAGSKIAADILEVPQSVSVVGQEELKDRAVQGVDEALRYTPGVFTQPFGSDSDTDWFYIRGFDATQTGVYWDSLQLYQYAFGTIQVDPFLVDRIEVLRGPASVLYGGSNAGGLVNIISKRADGLVHRYVEAGTTDDPNGWGGFDLGTPIGEGPWSVRAVGRLKGGATQTDDAETFRGTILPSATFDNGDTRAEFYASYKYDDGDHQNGFFPYVGTVRDAPYGRIPRDLYTGQEDIDRLESHQFTVGTEVEHRLSDNVLFRSNTRYLYLDREEEYPYVFDFVTTDDVLGRINFGHDTTVDQFNTDHQVVISYRDALIEQEILAGVDYRFFQIDQTQATRFPAPDLDPENPSYDFDPDLFELADPYIDETITQHQLGFYLQDQIKFGNGFILTANGRHDAVWTDRDDRLAADADYDGYDGALSGRAGFAYEFWFGLVPYVSASAFFTPQIGNDEFGNVIEPQTGEQWEAGLKYRPTFMNALITASVFDLRRRNTLQSVFTEEGTFNRALGAVRSRGIEIEASANLTPGIKLIGAFSTLDLEIEKDVNQAIVGNQPFLVPETQASLWATYTVPKGTFAGVEVGAGVRYLGESWADNENTLKVPDATVFDARIAYERNGYGISLNVDNVFDEDYVSGCQGVSTCSYGEGRQFLIKGQATF